MDGSLSLSDSQAGNQPPVPHHAQLTLPYAHLNLRHNPFGELTADERAQLAIIGFEPESYTERLSEPGFAVQFTGKKGRGKSTHLFALHAYFPEAPFTYVSQVGPVPAVPDTPVQFIDEMQRIPRQQRKEILRRPASFVIGSHTDHSREFERAGLSYKVFSLQGLSVPRLMAIIGRRLAWARRLQDQPLPTISETSARNLIATYGDDVRAIENHLYDVIQDMSGVGEMTIEPPNTPKWIKERLRRAIPYLDAAAYHRLVFRLSVAVGRLTVAAHHDEHAEQGAGTQSTAHSQLRWHHDQDPM